ncbi:MAG: DNA polymerase III subunit delta [Evtepia sp.]
MPAKKTDRSGYKKLKKDLLDNTIGSLYIFHGEETYLRDFYLEQLRKKIIPPGMGDFNDHRIDGKSATVQAISELVNALPMMSERTLVSVIDFDLFSAPEAERNALVTLLSDLPAYCCLVFIYDIQTFKSDARMKKLSAVIRDHGVIVSFAQQESSDLIAWIRRRFRALDHDISSADAEYLIFLCGDLMNGLISEIEKIGAYAKATIISRADIDAVAIPQPDAVVFQMTDALTAQNFDQAAAILGDLLQMQQAPIMIIAVLGKQLRQLLTARLLLDAGQGSHDLMELWGMRVSYPAERLMNAARRFSYEWCAMAVRRCAQTDVTLKSVSGVDGRDLLVNLLLELADLGGKKYATYS